LNEGLIRDARTIAAGADVAVVFAGLPDSFFPFGHGLSYTEFTYKRLELGNTAIVDNDGLTVHVTVANTGRVAGKEVVQLYVSDRTDEVTRPEKELKAFAKIALAPGEEKTVTFTLGYRDFAYYGADVHDWCVPSGIFEIRAGRSSADLPLIQSVAVTSTHPHVSNLTRDSMVKAFENHPRGHAVYNEVMDIVMTRFSDKQVAATTPEEKAARARAARMEAAVLRDLPFYRLATLFGHPFTETSVRALLEKAGVA
jgi:beta-glucosidase